MTTTPNLPNDNMQSQNDTLLRQLAMIKHIPRHPRQITARELTERVEAEGFVISKRSVERDLLSLSEVFPLISNERSRPYGWSWSKDAEAFSLPGMSPLQALTFELAHDHLVALLPASLLETLAPYFKCAEGVLTSGDGLKKLASWRKKVAIVPSSQPLLPPNCPEEIIEAVHAALLSDRVGVKEHPRGERASRVFGWHVARVGLAVRSAVLT